MDRRGARIPTTKHSDDDSETNGCRLDICGPPFPILISAEYPMQRVEPFRERGLARKSSGENAVPPLTGRPDSFLQINPFGLRNRSQLPPKLKKLDKKKAHPPAAEHETSYPVPDRSRWFPSRRLLLQYVERDHFPLLFGRDPLGCLFSEAAGHVELYDFRHKSPHYFRK